VRVAQPPGTPIPFPEVARNVRIAPPEVRTCSLWRYRLKVRTEPSQGSNPGSSPGIATKLQKDAYCVWIWPCDPFVLWEFHVLALHLLIRKPLYAVFLARFH
jgi:hypothetical protein